VIDVGGEGVAEPRRSRRRIPSAGDLVAACSQAAGIVRLTLGRNGGARERQVAIAGDRADNPLAAALWARLRIAALEGEYELNKAAIRRLGKTFGLVTRETSLIVLDRVEDYARFEIVPPPELMAATSGSSGFSHSASARTRARSSSASSRCCARRAWWRSASPRRAAHGPVDREARRCARTLRDGLLRQRGSSARTRAPAAAPPQRPGHIARSRRRERRRARPADRDPAQALDARRAYIARLREAPAADLYRVPRREAGLQGAPRSSSTRPISSSRRASASLASRADEPRRDGSREPPHPAHLGYGCCRPRAAARGAGVQARARARAGGAPVYRDLGLAYAADGQRQKAVDMLYEVVARPWHGRFPEVELIALAELNALVATTPTPLDTSRFDPRVLKNLPVDLRVVLTWDADNTDIDLWVTDPNGERAYYGNPLTFQGGRMSRDFTGGYGPEEFSLKQAKPGKYTIQANFYGHRQQIVAGATTLQVKLQTRFGTRAVEERIVMMRLQSRGGMVGRRFGAGSGDPGDRYDPATEAARSLCQPRRTLCLLRAGALGLVSRPQRERPTACAERAWPRARHSCAAHWRCGGSRSSAATTATAR
jgi:hypothetical protein